MSNHIANEQEAHNSQDIREDYDHFMNPLYFNVYPYYYLNDELFLNKDNWPELKQFMGGKGLSLAIMTSLGINVPDGFTLSTNYGRDLYKSDYRELPAELKKTIYDATIALRNNSGAKFADPSKPLAVAARSGAATSMPGAMDSILNIGFSRDNIDIFAKQMGTKEAWECFHIFCFGWAASQLGISKNKLEKNIRKEIEISKHSKIIQTNKTTAHFQEEIDFLEYWLQENYKITIPNTPEEQLYTSTLAVYRSYHSPEAIKYRHRMGIAEESGTTAVNVLAMVYGNQGEISGSGVVFSHDPKTGKPGLDIEFANGRSGDAVVAGTGDDFDQELTPELQAQLEEVIQKLVSLEGKPVDVEFVIENGKLYFVQYRNLRLTLPAMLEQISQDLIKQYNGKPDVEKALVLREKLDAHLLFGLGERFTQEDIDLSRKNENTKTVPRLIAKGQAVGGRAQSGEFASSLDEAQQILAQGKNVVLVLKELENANEILNLNNTYTGEIAVVTISGSPSSHAAYVLGTENVAGVIGCRNLPLELLKIGDQLSVDGVNGEVHLGTLSVAQYRLEKEISDLVEKRKKMGFSAWESIVHQLGLEDRLYELEEQIEQLFDDFNSGEGLKSAKALTQQIINRAFPKEFLTDYKIVSIPESGSDSHAYKEEIIQMVREGWEQGYDVSVRSAYSFTMDDSGEKLGVNPWIMLKPGEEDRLTEFLNSEKSAWKYGTLATWKTHEADKIKLTEVLIGYNHAGKLDEDKASDHAVGMVDSEIGSKNIVSGSFNLDTAHLRSYEEGHYKPDHNVKYKINFNQDEARVILSFGKDHINIQAVAGLASKMKRTKTAFLTTEEKAVKKDLLTRLGVDELDQFSKVEFTINQLVDELMTMIEEGELPTILLKELIVKRSWNRVDKLVRKLITDYVIAVAPGLAAVENWLSKITGEFSEVTIEFQAGFDNHGQEGDQSSLDWMAVYGLKGLEEVLLSL